MKRTLVLAAIFVVLFSGSDFSADYGVTFSENGMMLIPNEETPDVDLNKISFDFNEIPQKFEFMIRKVYRGEFEHPNFSMKPYPDIRGAIMYLFLIQGGEDIKLFVSMGKRNTRKTYVISCSPEEMKCRSQNGFTWDLSFFNNAPYLDAEDGWSAMFEEVGTLPSQIERKEKKEE